MGKWLGARRGTLPLATGTLEAACTCHPRRE
jgi:hypothetical protein